ncbi:MAG: thioredoxin family protein [Candidatus Staskawiczbacteria bacterium]|nr:thioredoxin family protein [Candidatus Staskawiczbacteria bacterium]
MKKNVFFEKGFVLPIIIGAIALVIIIGGALYFVSTKNSAKNQDSMMNESQLSETVVENMAEGYKGELLAGGTSPLLDFNKEDYQKALATDKLVLLYFYANWCPICKEEVNNSLYPAFNELTTDKVIGFRVNYNDNQTDNDERDLAREFGIAYQHSKILLKNGERVLKSPESWNKARYFEEINKNQ